ncbi:hypothetical protein BC937DRAFT_94958 [Endogone sp. FLAS-F59071]|nr:hypothetical protein BC937DRAFT_94958 [Endogone sp. FLAS-F59071]|eukprot:RUS13671.1 hypothetical protein BC937DRAFT_94958 [Endogone sp. FLAS-F59071]
MSMASPPINYLSLPATSEAVAAYHRRPSLGFLFAPLNQKAPRYTHPSTNKVILHYLLHLSIQSRLKQADLELNELRAASTNANDEGAAERQRIRMETANRAEKDKNAVESIVSGILSSHRSRTPGVRLDLDLKHRLYLCQVTNLIFGRFDANPNVANTGAGAGAPTPSVSSSSRRRRHLESSADPSDAIDAQEREGVFGTPVTPLRCRRHRCPSCQTCRSPSYKNAKSSDELTPNDHANVTSSHRRASLAPRPPPGLINAIPAFLRASAMSLRRSLEEENAAERKNHHLNRVMGGGMPSTWYDLFLDLLTQAAIESYLCDGRTGMEAIFEIFSWGDVEPEDEANYVDDEEWDEAEDEDEDDDGDESAVRAADYHLLFPKTRTMFLLSETLREREREVSVWIQIQQVEYDDSDEIIESGDLERVVDGFGHLVLQGKVKGTLEEHFDSLAQKYPLEKFETDMRVHIDTVQKTMAAPMLCKYENLESDGNNLGPVTSPSSTITTSSSTSPPSSASPSSVPDSRPDFRSSTIAPSLLKFPGDGALLMPEVPDSDDEFEDENELNGQPASRVTLAQPLQLPTPTTETVMARKRAREEQGEYKDDEEEGKEDSQYMEQEAEANVAKNMNPAKKTKRN